MEGFNTIIYSKIRSISHFIKKIALYYLPDKCSIPCERGKQIFSSVYFDQDLTFVFSHGLGGGAEKFLKDKISNGDIKPSSLIMVYPVPDNYGYYMEIDRNGTVKRYYYPFVRTLMNCIKRAVNSRIIVNDLYSYVGVYSILDSLVRIKLENNARLSMYLHDYYCICDNVHLYDRSDKRYCGLNKCDKCDNTDTDIFKWSREWYRFLKQCDCIVAFSEDTRERVLSIYDGLVIDVQPHKPEQLRKAEHNSTDKKTIKIGILGALSDLKGAGIIEEMVSSIEEKKINLEILLIGYSGEFISKEINKNHYSEYGEYDRKQLPEIVEKEGVDAIFIPSVVPETFSYTTREAIMMEMPLFCFDLGAQAEQVKKYVKGTVIKEISADCALQTIYEQMIRKV